jgi:hypothetical protein
MMSEKPQSPSVLDADYDIPCPAHGLPCVRRPHCEPDECKDQDAHDGANNGAASSLRDALQAILDSD